MNNSFKKEVMRILKSETIDLFNNKYDFNGARRAVFNSLELQALMKQNGLKNILEISSGVSDKKAYPYYVTQLCADIKSEDYYRNYYGNKGDNESRSAIAYYESLKLKNKYSYSAENICLTEGSTGAISAVIEYVKRVYPLSEAIITNPCYYLYKSACNYFGLTYKEINLFSKTNIPSFTSIGSIIGSITNKTKLIIINNPFNPSGELYTKKDIRKLLMEAKKRNLLVLCDELFCDLVFNTSQFSPSDETASELDCLENLIVIKGYSKNKNLVAFRFGYVFSKNQSIIDGVGKINQVRQSFPTASNFSGFLCLDSFIQSVLWISNKTGRSISYCVKKVRKDFPTCQSIATKSDSALLKIVDGYQLYFDKIMKEYSDTYDLSVQLLKDESSFIMPKASAFNTFIKIPKLDRVNMFDFTLNFYITTGVKVEIGPCFGFSQRDWETNPNLGFWLRVTFAKDEQILREGITKFVWFTKEYLRNKNKMIITNLSY